MAITNYKNIQAIKNRMVELINPTFTYDFICREEIVNGNDKLSNKKASQNTDIPVKIIKETQRSYFMFFISQF